MVDEVDGPVRVLALSGIRSEWDLLQPVLSALDADPGFTVDVVASGAHPTPIHDYSVRQIVEDGFDPIATIYNLVASDAPTARAVTAANLLSDLAGTLERHSPDLLLVLGDREEALVGALAGTYARVPVVHLAGGDHTHPAGGNIDEEIRHAATKLAHVHLTMADDHSERVRRLGEEPWRVHTVGSAGLDKLRTTEIIPREQLAELLGPAALGDYVIVIHHPIHAQPADGAAELTLILDRVVHAGVHAFVGAPNTDTGSHLIRAAIGRWGDEPLVHPYRNLPRKPFVSLLTHAQALVGNSSLGLHEASLLALPVINVGQRQRGRLAGVNVQWVDAEELQIDSAIAKALRDHEFRSSLAGFGSPYGDGHTAERVVRVLRELPRRSQLLDKSISY